MHCNISASRKKCSPKNSHELEIIKEDQPRWLNFLKGKVDYVGVPKDNFETAVTPDKGLSEELAKKGISLLITSRPWNVFIFH